MRVWDLSTGVARLEDAIDTLHKAMAGVQNEWDDDTFRQFRDNCLGPLEPKAQRAVDAIHRLAQVLARAQRECESY